jgi:hypothetical protein
MEHMPLFSTGMIEVTEAAAAACLELGEEPSGYVARHRAGDWGEVDPEQREASDFGGHLLITDLHPACTAQGWHAQVVRPGIVYAMPAERHTPGGLSDCH